MKTMNSDFKQYIENKIKTSLSYEKELNEALLSLYEMGLIEVTMDEGEPLISISEAGEGAYASMLLATMPVMGEA